MNVKIELPATYAVAKGDRAKTFSVEVTCDVGKLSPEIIAELAMHGLHQKIADAASQAKNADEAEAAMQKAVDALLAGEWTRRGSGGGVTEEVAVARSVTRAMVKAKFGAKSAEWATFTGLSDADQNAKLDEWFAANEAALAPERDAEIARRRAKAEAKRKAANAVEFKL